MVEGSHAGESEGVPTNKEDDDSNMLVPDSEFEELLKQFSLRLQAVHNIPQNSSMLSSARSSRFLKLRPNVSNDWLHSIRERCKNLSPPSGTETNSLEPRDDSHQSQTTTEQLNQSESATI